MEKTLLLVLALFSFTSTYVHCLDGGFRCYVGNSADPDNIETEYVPIRQNSEPRCFRYEKPTCFGCTTNCSTTNFECNCYGGCDEVSIQNATYTWYYGVLGAGVCSDIPNNWSYWMWYRNAICCGSDLCNYPINSATRAVPLLSLLIVILHALVNSFMSR